MSDNMKMADDTAPILIEVGAGELMDKLSILQIKTERITDAAQLANVRREQKTLDAARAQHLPANAELKDLSEQLKACNERLWDVEDQLRRLEADKNFGKEFVELARAVYVTNDKRAALKKEINLLTGARIVEEKSYVAY